jgi:hypothetical protein
VKRLKRRSVKNQGMWTPDGIVSAGWLETPRDFARVQLRESSNHASRDNETEFGKGGIKCSKLNKKNKKDPIEQKKIPQ